MHASNDSLLGHKYANEVIAVAQCLLSAFRASHRPYKLLKDAAKVLGKLLVSLLTSDPPCLTSIYECLKSVQNLELALQQLAKDQPQAIPTSKG